MLVALCSRWNGSSEIRVRLWRVQTFESQTMKRSRTMLLCVTATSITAIAACEPAAHPVGMNARDPETMSADAAHQDTTADAAAPVEAPSVGTTAQAPDTKK